jgi:hypothetical protein
VVDDGTVPEQRLLEAIVLDAKRDLARPGRREQALAFFEGGPEVSTFPLICELMNMPLDVARGALRDAEMLGRSGRQQRRPRT